MIYEKKILPNELRVLTLPMKHIESVTVQVFVRAGGRDEIKDLAGISHFLEHTVFKGTKNRPNMKAISEEVERVGGFFNAATSTEYTTFYVKVPKDKIEIAFDVLSDSLLNSLFKKEAIEKERQVIIEEINVYEDMPMAKVESVFSALLFPNHALGYDLAGTKKTVSSISRQDLTDYLKKHYLAKNMLLIVVGNFDSTKTLQLVKKYFNPTKQGKLPEVNSYKEKQNKVQIKAFYKKIDQTHLCLGFKALKRGDSDRFKLAVLNAVLGSGASSRLFESLREKEGLCYYVSSDVDSFLDTGVWYAKAGVDNLRVERAIKLMMDEFLNLTNCRVTKKELNRAKEYLKGSLRLSMELSDAQGSFYGMQELFGMEVLTVEQVCGKIDKVTTDDLLDLARKLVREDKLNLALVGPIKDEERFRKLVKI